MKSEIHENKKSKLPSLSKNLLMLLVAVLGTSAMVNAFPPVVKSSPVKEVKATRPKNKSEKKAKSEKKEALKSETSKMKK